MSDLHCVIMAGGRGTRFWPVSTRERPKQFLDLTGCGRTMIQATADRVRRLCPPERTLVVTGERYDGLVRDQLPELPARNVLLEPSGRNTAACIGWAAGTVSERAGGAAPMAVLPSDHIVPDVETFAEDLASAVGAAMGGRMVTLGVQPDRPATGYGYIEVGEEVLEGTYRVSRFLEKPDASTAARLLSDGGYLWNAGIFVFRAGVVLEELERYLPGLRRGLSGLGPDRRPEREAWERLDAVSIDYGVMERSERVAVVPARFAWDDAGDWPAARRCGAGRGEVLSLESGDCTVWSEEGLTVLLGVSGLSVVRTGDVTLVMSDARAQELRKVVATLERERPELV